MAKLAASKALIYTLIAGEEQGKNAVALGHLFIIPKTHKLPFVNGIFAHLHFTPSVIGKVGYWLSPQNVTGHNKSLLALG